MKSIICFLFGHKKAVPMLIENEHAIYGRGCPRCKKPVMIPVTWKHCPPPPGRSTEEWKIIKDEIHQDIRDSILELAN